MLRPTCAGALVALTGLFSFQAAGAQLPPSSPDHGRMSLDFTLLDAPYNVSFGGRAPSMGQSLDLTVAGYELSHGAIERAFGRRRVLGRTATAVYDVLTSIALPLPFTDVWVHEEFHRAQMGRRGVGSFDDVYRFDPNAASIAVSHVRDEDLIQLKADHPAEWVRVSAAGMEGEIVLVRELETRQFLGRSRGWHVPVYWMAKLSTAVYVASGTWRESDIDTDSMNLEDGADIPRRDFTGHDFIAWVYDLHRPNEPYTARGVHPSGVGIDRYRKVSDLTEAERRFLKLQGKLQLLNFADPFLFGMSGVRLGGDDARPVVAMASLGHMLTAFGYTIDGNVMVRRGETAFAATVHGFVNGARVFPGLELTAFDRPARIAGLALQVTPRVAVWLQPDGQAFRTRDARLGGLASIRVHGGGRGRLRAFVELDGKSAGWVAGNPYLDANVAVRMGLTAMLE